MFYLSATIENIKTAITVNDRVVVSGDEIKIYDADRLEVLYVYSAKSWISVSFNNFYLFQVENGANFSYINLASSDFSVNESLGRYYLSRHYFVDGKLFIVDSDKNLVVFNEDLEIIGNILLSGLLPKSIYKDSIFRVSGTTLSCFVLTSGVEIWKTNIAEIDTEARIEGSEWFIEDIVVVSTLPKSIESSQGGNRLLWVDIGTGRVLRMRTEPTHMMQKLENDLYYLNNPAGQDGYLRIISLKDASTKLDISTCALFSPYFLPCSSYDNYKFVKQNALLYILHVRDKAVTIVNLDIFQILCHLKVNSKAESLRTLTVLGNTLFIIDELYTLYIYKSNDLVQLP